MRKTTWFTALLGAGAFIACSAPGAGGEDTPPVNGVDETDAGGSAPDALGTSSGGSSGTPTPTNADVKLSSATAQVVGRNGEDLRIVASGTDGRKLTASATVKVVDAAGQPVIALDTDWDGEPDSAERRFRFDKSTIGKSKFTGIITVPGMIAAAPTAAKVIVTLEDDTGARSTSITADIAAQPVRSELDACDPDKIADRCLAGMSCSGTPSTCHAAVAPAFTQTAYFGGESPRMLFRGSEPDEDVKRIEVEFLDANGNGTSVSIDGDGSDAAPGFTLDARSSATGSDFVLVTRPVKSFAQKVPKIAATVSDELGNASARTIISLSTPPSRAVGQACDWAGFDACTSGNVCAPGIAGEANVCASEQSVRTSKCGAAQKLDPAAGKTRTFGWATGVSLWDPPTGCTNAEATGRPEGAVALHLKTAAKTLTITTALPETAFDTVVYLVPACDASSAKAFGCNDDTKGFSSTLTLTNVPAGDYTIIVDSVHTRGGRYGISVSVE